LTNKKSPFILKVYKVIKLLSIKGFSYREVEYNMNNHPLTIREVNGRILGYLDSNNEFWKVFEFENESYQDYKLRPEEIIMPKHNYTEPSEVKVYHISELK
jgi:hypothetical protein